MEASWSLVRLAVGLLGLAVVSGGHGVFRLLVRVLVEDQEQHQIATQHTHARQRGRLCTRASAV